MPRVVVKGGPGVGKTTLLAQLHAGGYTQSASQRVRSFRNVEGAGRAHVLSPPNSRGRFFAATPRSITLTRPRLLGSSSIGASSRRLACFTRSRRCPHRSLPLRLKPIGFTRRYSYFRRGGKSTRLMPSETTHFPG